MKQFTFKFLAISLIITALLLTTARLAISYIDSYKAQLIEWIAKEHKINVTVDKISAGVDFSGLVLTLKNVDLVDAPILPFELKLAHVFIHLDFRKTIEEQKLVFTDISLKGVDVVLKPDYVPSEEDLSKIILDSLKNIFLARLKSFSVADSQFHFTDHLYIKKTILIQELSWFNNGKKHQGTGKASLPNTLGENSLEFFIDVTGDPKGDNEQLLAHIYANADNLNITEYLKPQINPLAELTTANVSFQFWSEFDFNGPKSIQFEFGQSQIAWSLLGKHHDWEVSSGSEQISYKDKKWLFDTYDLAVKYNYIPRTDLTFSGSGIVGDSGKFDFNGLNLNDSVPFALLFSSLNEDDINLIRKLEIDGELKNLQLMFDEHGELTLATEIDSFNNQAVDLIPGISDADIVISSKGKRGQAHIKLAAQDIHFDRQFSRAMPLINGDLTFDWENTETGLNVIGKNILLNTDDLNASTQFSLFIPNENAANPNPFLGLYSYVSMPDAGKLQYYLPIEVMGQEAFDYLQPAVKKGTIKGAKVLWYGEIDGYPFADRNGVLQISMPIENGQYDFYEEWEGLTNLDANLLLENDSLKFEVDKATLGAMTVGSLTAEIDHLTTEGRVLVNASAEDSAKNMFKYVSKSPLKDSVGEALKVININDQLNGNITLTIPFAEDLETKIVGELNLIGNAVNVKISDDLIVPLKDVKGKLNLVDSEITAKELSANLFGQPYNFSFSTKDLDDEYRVNMDFDGHWDAGELSLERSELTLLQLSGTLDWQGDFEFSQFSDGTYLFDMNLSSPLQGMKTTLPSPYNKNALQKWPSKLNFKGNEKSAKWFAQVSNKIQTTGQFNYQTDDVTMPYAYFGLGDDQNLPIDYTKQVIRVNENKTSLSEWAPTILALLRDDNENGAVETKKSLIDIDDIYIDVKQADFFDEPFVNFNSHIKHDDNFWDIHYQADDLLMNVEFRKGIPDRYDVKIEQLNFQLFDLDAAVDTLFKKDDNLLDEQSANLREEYPEIFLECKSCIYQKQNFSDLKTHTFPSRSRYTIDYLNFGDKKEFTNISGVWDQRRTNIIIDSKSNSDNSIIDRLGFISPVVYKESEFSGALNWVGAPWQYNFESLNGDLSTKFENGMITEVSDKGARLLSFLSLDAIRRSLNLEYGNVFSDGLGFDEMSFSSHINNGIVKTDDFYLDGSAGKIAGGGLVDLPNWNVNYNLSYSPAVTSSLPVLTAFAVNPLTGAAVLMLTKILEPVLDTIIRVDFSVKGSLSSPIVKMESSEQGQVKLKDASLLEGFEEKTNNAQ